MTKPPKEKVVSMRLTADEWQTAHAVAAADGQSLTEWYRSALRRASRAARKPVEAAQT
jgi:uncharacterized protein (DUF1778 family)